jgi:imidazole glycerol phosphate synthase subunit HisF
LKGSIALGDRSKVFDIIGGNDIELGENCVATDSVIHSVNGKVLISMTRVGGVDILQDNDRVVKPNEVNVNEKAVRNIDYNVMLESLRNSFDVLKQI